MNKKKIIKIRESIYWMNYWIKNNNRWEIKNEIVIMIKIMLLILIDLIFKTLMFNLI